MKVVEAVRRSIRAGRESCCAMRLLHFAAAPLRFALTLISVSSLDRDGYRRGFWVVMIPLSQRSRQPVRG